jgi:hypothetical protein
MEEETPSLIENGTTSFLYTTLYNCHIYKVKYNNYIFNITSFFILIVGLSILLIYRYKGKPSPDEILRRETDKKNYIMSKIYNYQQNKLKQSQNLITNLPRF